MFLPRNLDLSLGSLNDDIIPRNLDVSLEVCWYNRHVYISYVIHTMSFYTHSTENRNLDDNCVYHTYPVTRPFSPFFKAKC